MSRLNRYDDRKGRGRRSSRDDSDSDGGQVERRGYQRGRSIDPKPAGIFQGIVESLFGKNTPPAKDKVQKWDSDSDESTSSSLLELELQKKTAKAEAIVTEVELLRRILEERRHDDRNPRKHASPERDPRKHARRERDPRKHAHMRHDVPASSSSSSSSLPVKPGPDADTVEKFKVFLRTLHPENLNSLLESAQNKTDMDFSFLDADRETTVRTLFGQLTRKQMVAAMQEIAWEFLVTGKGSGKPKSTGGTKAKEPTAQPVAKVVPKADKKPSAKVQSVERNTDSARIAETFTDPAEWLEKEVKLRDVCDRFTEVMEAIQEGIKEGVKMIKREKNIFGKYAESPKTMEKFLAERKYTLNAKFTRKYCVGVMLAGFQRAIGMVVPRGCKDKTNTVRYGTSTVETWKLVSEPISRIEASKRVARALLVKLECPEPGECVSYLFEPWNKDESDAEIDHSSDKKGVAKHDGKKKKQKSDDEDDDDDGDDGDLEHTFITKGGAKKPVPLNRMTRGSSSEEEDDDSNSD